jgi:hypothetical protein
MSVWGEGEEGEPIYFAVTNANMLELEFNRIYERKNYGENAAVVFFLSSTRILSLARTRFSAENMVFIHF